MSYLPSWIPATQVLQQKYTQLCETDFDTHMYYAYKNKWESHYQNRIDQIFLASKHVTLPITFEPFKEYFSGFTFEFRSYDNTHAPTLDGHYDHNDGHVRIFFADNCCRERQRFTMAHELTHFYQSLDYEFMAEMEAIRNPLMRKKLFESIANAAAAYYLVPKPALEAVEPHKKTITTLSSLFEVSEKTMEICLKDYGLTINETAHVQTPW